MGAAVEESRARPSKQGNNAGLVVDKNTNGGDSEVSNKKLNMDSRSMSLIQKSSCSKPQMSLLRNKSVKVQLLLPTLGKTAMGSSGQVVGRREGTL